MKLLVIGHARHGKDTVGAMLRQQLGLKFISSSLFAAAKAVVPYLAAKGIEYDSLDEAYADRVNHRAAWRDAIGAYNTPDPAKLGREIFAEYDMYIGLRSLEEFVALHKAKVFDYCIWVDRSAHAPAEPYSSMELTPNLADIVVDNNFDLVHLAKQVQWAVQCLRRLEHSRANAVEVSSASAEKS